VRIGTAFDDNDGAQPCSSAARIVDADFEEIK
jgi:hypothetical protein